MVAAAAAGAAPVDGLPTGESGRATSVIDGDTLEIDGELRVRLVGLQAPKLALGRRGLVDWSFAAEARDTLAGLVGGEMLTLHYGGVRRDRHGRALAHVVRGDGLWIQRAMVRAGMARVYGFADNRALLGELLVAEAAARAELRGLWAHPLYRVRTVDGLEAEDMGQFQLVEGRVVSAAVVRGRVYLNFGEDWRTDFTVTVAPRNRPLFERVWAAAGVESTAALKGRRVRVRGWLQRYNGPEIIATHPEQIELLGEPP